MRTTTEKKSILNFQNSDIMHNINQVQFLFKIIYTSGMCYVYVMIFA